MPEATEDESYNLVNGESVDMYKVANPKVKQSFLQVKHHINFM